MTLLHILSKNRDKIMAGRLAVMLQYRSKERTEKSSMWDVE